MRGSTLTCGVIHLSDPRSVDDQKDNIVVTFYKDFILIILFIGRGSVKRGRRLFKFIEKKKRAQELNTRHLGLSEPPRFVFPTCNNKFSNLPLLQIQTHNHWFAQPASLPDSLKDQNSLFTALSCLPDRFYCNPGNPYIITQCRAFFFNLARPASSNVQWQITTGFHSRTR